MKPRTCRRMPVLAMRSEQLRRYREDGFVVIDDCLCDEEIAALRAVLPHVLATNGPQRVLEKDQTTVRSVYGPHLLHEVFHDLAHDPRILTVVQEIIEGDAYIYQSKINVKRRLSGDLWMWHQDFVFWLCEDGVPEPHLTTAAVFLDDVTESNGPLLFVPGSHRSGVVTPKVLDQAPADYAGSPAWLGNLTADLKYTIDPDAPEFRSQASKIVAATGRRGSLLFFDPNVFHASQPNRSGSDRALLLITYNWVGNRPLRLESPRPEFLCSRSFDAARSSDRFSRTVRAETRGPS